MRRRLRRRGGFTLIEVTFATGILFLTLVMLLGALSHLALTRELGERRHLASMCLAHCLEQLQAQSPSSIAAIQLSPPEDLPGEFVIDVSPEESVLALPVARITVSTHSLRGHAVEASAVYVIGASDHAP